MSVQEVAVETFGAMAKTEKIAYILEQVRGWVVGWRGGVGWGSGRRSSASWSRWGGVGREEEGKHLFAWVCGVCGWRLTCVFEAV